MRTGFMLFWAGQRGHIAFGCALLGLQSVIARTDVSDNPSSVFDQFTEAQVAPVLATAWALMAVGVLIQGACAPMLMNALRVVPKGRPPHENKHTEKQRHGVMKFLVRDVQV